MANLACNGCLLTIDNRSFNYSTPNATGSYDYYVSGYSMSGNGIGLLSGLTGVQLCFVDVLVSSPSSNGNCTSYTGYIRNLRPGGHPNSPTGWTGTTGATGCTGSSGCRASLDFYVDPNYALFNAISGSTLNFSVYSFYDGSYNSVQINEFTPIYSGGQWTGIPVHMPTVTGGCGEAINYLVEARWLTPLGVSGQVLSSRSHVASCSYCSQYEMVSLP